MLHPDVVYGYSPDRPDVCLLLRGRVLVTVLSRRSCAGRPPRLGRWPMSIDLPALAELGDPARTNQVGLYKLIDDRPFDECWQPPEDDGFDSIPVPDLGEALLVFGQLVHVKRVSSTTGSGPLSHLIAQGIVAIESLTDPGTWRKFVEEVRAQDPARAATLGARPPPWSTPSIAATACSPRRSCSPSPARRWRRWRPVLAKIGIPLQICVIP